MKNINSTLIYALALMGLFLIFTNSCKKDDNKNNPTQPEIITDIDGNIYHTITIGTQVWMVENLNVTHYRNGDPIPNITDSASWRNLTIGAYCNYNNADSNSKTYGKLYNWYVCDINHIIAPAGWHVPNSYDWLTLILYLGTESVAGGKLKETGFRHWTDPNGSATNEMGFTALPGGYRVDGAFVGLSINGNWWTSSGIGNMHAIGYDITCLNGFVREFDGDIASGASVRCVKDK
jgi:uncharacterized protein (TIGR02145 family)